MRDEEIARLLVNEARHIVGAGKRLVWEEHGGGQLAGKNGKLMSPLVSKDDNNKVIWSLHIGFVGRYKGYWSDKDKFQKDLAWVLVYRGSDPVIKKSMSSSKDFEKLSDAKKKAEDMMRGRYSQAALNKLGRYHIKELKGAKLISVEQVRDYAVITFKHEGQTESQDVSLRGWPNS